MSSRNFNTSNMKISIADIDEDDRVVEPLTSFSFDNLKKAIEYSAERTIKRDTNVRLIAVLGPDVHLTLEQTNEIMFHLNSKGAGILSTSDDLIVAKIQDGESFRCLSIKIIGGAKFVAIPLPATDESFSNIENPFPQSQYQVVDDLELECDLTK